MERFWKIILLLLSGYLLAVMLMNPEGSMDAASKALLLCFETVIPALFPFFVCSHLLIDLGAAGLLSRYLSPLMRPLFGIPGSGALAVVLGLVSGYPVGAECIVGLYTSGNCSRSEAERMLTFCNNSGPLFVMGAVGVGMFGGRELGGLLYLIHAVSALLTGVLFRGYGKETATQSLVLPAGKTRQNPIFAFGTAVADGVTAILKVCGFVVLFAVVTAALPKDSAPIYAMLEITGGIARMVEMGSFGTWLLPAVSFFLACSGVSVLMQAAAIVLPAGLSLKPYLLGKLTQGCLAYGLTVLALRFLPVSVPGFAGGAGTFLPNGLALLCYGGMMLFWSLCALAAFTLAVWLYDHRK